MVTRALVMTLALATSNAYALRDEITAVAHYVGVPADILYAMAIAESGRYEKGEMHPWPWTLNVAGEARYYDTREAMYADLMAELQGGTLSIDVGPIRVNWFWQFKWMRSQWRITDPRESIKIAAQILRGFYEETGDWWVSVGRYHRPSMAAEDQVIADQYRARVRKFHARVGRDADV